MPKLKKVKKVKKIKKVKKVKKLVDKKLKSKFEKKRK